jgi:hypothetical protein
MTIRKRAGMLLTSDNVTPVKATLLHIEKASEIW